MAQILFTLPKIGNKNCLTVSKKQSDLNQFFPIIPSPPKEEKQPPFLIPSFPTQHNMSHVQMYCISKLLVCGKYKDYL